MHIYTYEAHVMYMGDWTVIEVWASDLLQAFGFVENAGWKNFYIVKA